MSGGFYKIIDAKTGEMIDVRQAASADAALEMVRRANPNLNLGNAVSVMPDSINKIGLGEIKEFLCRKHKSQDQDWSDEQLRAWARDAEFQAGEGNWPDIELRESESRAGWTETFDISAAGIDWTEVTDDDGDADEVKTEYRAVIVPPDAGSNGVGIRLTNECHSRLTDEDLIKAAMPALEEYNRAASSIGAPEATTKDLRIGMWKA